jgi:hypothetical protein
MLPLGEYHHDAIPRQAAKWAQSARGFSQPAIPWAHWSVAFAHYLMLWSFTNAPVMVLDKCSCNIYER